MYSQKRRQNYYGAKKQYVNGQRYDSGFEAQEGVRFQEMLERGEIKDLERQVKIDLRAYDKHITNYYIDFVVTHNDDSKEYIEVKGFATEVWRLKWKLFEAQMNELEPGSVLTVITQGKNPYKRRR